MKYQSLCDRIIANSVMHEDYMYKGTPCWVWVGSKATNRNGTKYPRMTVRVKGKPRGQKAHRISLREFHGVKLRKDKVAAHLCNNPLCVNPAHLKLVGQDVNVQQCVEDGRHRGFQNREPGQD